MVDVVTAIVAVLALILSSITAYYQFIRKVQDLKVSLLGARSTPQLTSQPEIEFKLVFASNGDLEAVVDDVSLLLPGAPGASHEVLPWDHFGDGSPAVPLSVGPGQLVHKSVVFRYYYEVLRCIDGPSTGTMIKLDGSIRFSVIDSSGRYNKRDLDGLELLVIDGWISAIVYPTAQGLVQLLP